jgi:tRNA dimethylallyltransferase
MLETIPVLAAPTASGKTAAVLQVADQLPGLEVISADALQVYRGFDIGTAKPTAAERARVPHHMLDMVDPMQALDVVTWVKGALAAVADVLARGGRPLVVAGTGFYLDALMHGAPTTPPASAAVRAAVAEALQRQGAAALLEELRALAPADAAASQGNPRRVVRALEVLRTTGKPPSAFGRVAPPYAFRAFVALPDVATLDARVATRVRAMLAAGWLDEVAALRAQVPLDAPAWQAIGYRTLAAVVAGEVPLAEAEAAVVLATRQYTKRQRTWFRRRPLEATRYPGALEGEGTAAFNAWMVNTNG